MNKVTNEKFPPIVEEVVKYYTQSKLKVSDIVFFIGNSILEISNLENITKEENKITSRYFEYLLKRLIVPLMENKDQGQLNKIFFNYFDVWGEEFGKNAVPIIMKAALEPYKRLLYDNDQLINYMKVAEFLLVLGNSYQEYEMETRHKRQAA